MALQPGTHLGRYEIVSLVGSGGMGEVYRARDPRLDRTVAIKVLPAELVADPEFRRRLEREAKTISRLQHPNVCTLHDYDTAAGADFLVLEYLEGQTLEDRIGRGRIPVEEATRIGGEIAEAIAAAHRLGIVHRDLKPGNVMLTATGAKVLDFGLARGTEASGGSLDSEAATMQATITEEGRMVGTMPYMAPEQLHGGTVDARTDIWALGCILYEMVTGQRPFTGASRADLIAAILGAEPEPPARKPLTPRHVDRVVRRCLEKDPDRRWHSAKDVALELGAPLEEPEIAAASGPPRVPTILAAALALLTLAAGLALGFALLSGSGNGPGSAAAGERWTISTLDLEGPVGRLSLSPDGRSLVFARHSDDPALYFRALDSRTERRLAGTERADDYSSFSPDGRQLVISHRGGGLMTLAVEGGAATPLVDEPASEPSWERDGYIYYTPVLPAMWTSTESLQLWRTAASGGVPEQVGHGLFASLLPGNRVVLTQRPTFREDQFWSHVFAVDLETGEELELAAGGQPRYLDPGFLVFYRDTALWAAPIDPRSGELRGQPRQVESEVVRNGALLDYGEFALADSGDLVVIVGARDRPGRLVWVNRDGRFVGEVAPETKVFGTPVLSPGRSEISVGVRTARGQERWSLDLETGSFTKPAQRGSYNGPTRWVPPAGQKIVFRSRRRIYVQAADRNLPAERLLTAEVVQQPLDISADGRFLVYEYEEAQGLQVLDMQTEQTSALVKHPPGSTHQSASFHPSGRWIAYSSGPYLGVLNIWICPFPGPCEPVQLTFDGGQEPFFSKDGSELFYRSPTHMMSMSIRIDGGRLVPGRAEPLFEDGYLRHFINGVAAYSVDADGRFLMIQPAEEVEQKVLLIQNWRAKVVQMFSDTGP